jgi:uncharacterized protein YjbJ (UPF0337 family)
VIRAGVAIAILAGTTLPLSATEVSPSTLLIVNQDQFEGNWKQFKGDLKKQWGKFTDDDLLVIEGNYDKLQGKIQERYGDRKEEVNKWTDEWMKKHAKKNGTSKQRS